MAFLMFLLRKLIRGIIYFGAMLCIFRILERIGPDISFLPVLDSRTWGIKNLEKYMSVDKSDWKSVPAPAFNISVYRAYSFYNSTKFGTPEATEVVIVASYLLQKWRKPKVTCQFHYIKDHRFSNATGEIIGMEWHAAANQYSGNFIKCPIPQKQPGALPFQVSILLENGRKKKATTTQSFSVTIPEKINKKHNATSNQTKTRTQTPVRLLIHYQAVAPESQPEPEKHYKFQFSVCVNQPVYNYNMVSHFLEWMEFYKLMGVQQFTFYNMSIGPDVSCVLNHLQQYAEEGTTINVEPWKKYPFPNLTEDQDQPGVNGHGVADSVSDCLLRHKGVTKYLVMVDLDEFIMPREESGVENYTSLIKVLDAKKPLTKFVEYRFVNGIFSRMQPNDELLDSRCEDLKGLENFVCKHLLMTRLTKGRTYPRVQFLSRILKPEWAKVECSYWLDERKKGYEPYYVPEELALLRHYQFRIWNNKSLETNHGGPFFVDRLPEELALKLITRVSKKVEYFRNACNLRVSFEKVVPL